MRITVCVLAVCACLAVTSGAVAADDSRPTITAAPPLQPLAITAAQALALEDLSRRPEHAPASQIRASYNPEAARKRTEFGVRATQIGIPGAILAVVIAAI